MDEIQIYVRVAILILGLAYPILLQVVARLDEKYASNHIVELFDKELSKRWFKVILIISLISIFIWTFKFKPLFQIDGLNYLINNSANLLVIVSSTLLVFVFFLFVNKILTYYTPVKFIAYLSKRHQKKSSDLRCFNALSDMFILSVRKQNHTISQTLSRFFYDAFNTERKKFASEPVKFPEDYYSLIYRTIEELAVQKVKKNSALEVRTSGGVWLLGELKGYEISEITYTWLWRNARLAIKYEQDDMILYHWEKAHQYIDFKLPLIRPEYGEGIEIQNESEIKNRKLERDRFLEFHYALGGLLLYKGRFDCIRRMFEYTTSEPPQYNLLPINMDEIFNRYNHFRDPYDEKFTWISTIYGFPEQNGINSDGVIKKWISKYIVVLFLRQYTLRAHYIAMKPLDNPMLPTTQEGKRKLINSLEFFNELLVDILDDSELISSLKLSFLTKEWAAGNDIIYPVKFIDELKITLIKEYEQGAINMAISDVKKAEFYQSSGIMIDSILEQYFPLSNENNIPEDYDSWFVGGQKMVHSKDAFSEEPEAHYMDFDTFLATVVTNEIREGITSTFRMNKTKSYLFKSEEIFNAISELGIDKNYVIVTFGINLKHYQEFLKIKGLSEGVFKGVNILSFNGSRSIRESIYVLKQNDLPLILTQEIDDEIKDKFSLEKISKTNNIYGSVLDCNLVSEEISLELSAKHTEEELKKSVLLSIVQSTEIRWNKNIEMIELIEYSEYRQDGLPNKLSDVVKLEKGE